ncbi:hypothetical protein SAMN04488074_13352 [Lentzea albidocapillata subsp. violacea]|uniref:Uncharacterized protein n=1 Tax=Lentzea albidocapillata subsp. violacea TaxID=128104 RepID=A0A1G9YG96_9PSEU|nr:hypothetical protein [Lentzea albidocapillata]SDN07992.1 hypothetical protein SAMN04488074_13352 [Lentzea albidocapillata subsp. violacea]
MTEAWEWARGTSDGQEFLEELPALALKLRADSRSLYDYFGLRREYAVELMVAHDAGAIEHALLDISHELLLSDRGRPAVVAWLSDYSKQFDELAWQRLRVPAGVAAGVVTGRQAVREIAGGGWLEPWKGGYEADWFAVETLLDEAEELHCELWSRLTVQVTLSRTSRWHHALSLNESAARHRLEQHAQQWPKVWAEAMPWLLAACKNSGGYLESLLVAKVALEDRLFRDAVESAAEHPHLAVRTPAQGVLARAGGVDQADLAQHLVEVVAALLDNDRSRIDAFPWPLAEPTHTWLSQRRLEDLVRDRAAIALNRFREVVRNQGAAEEDALTGRLLDRLESEFSKIDAELTLTESHGVRKPEVSLAQRPVRKADERTVGADVGLVVAVDLPGRLKVRFGELVQVKKSSLLHGTGGSVDSWRIEIRQLHDLLEHSPTAVYWLIQAAGDVLCVPAKLVHAIIKGRDKPSSLSLTIRYSEIRHAAIGLGQYLRDLLMGMWVGNCGEPTLSVASGVDDRIRPMHILAVAVRVRSERDSGDQQDR